MRDCWGYANFWREGQIGFLACSHDISPLYSSSFLQYLSKAYRNKPFSFSFNIYMLKYSFLFAFIFVL
uniref:Ovule protein n=1 Tax=Ascaris lumbricoides TaxID=6252 RepID=A0A0M3INM2_ASCLU